MIEIAPGIVLSEKSLEFRFVRASGPGGQHVNKTETAVQLKFDPSSAGLAPEVVERLARLAGRRMGADGVVTIVARRFRSQERNRQDALDRLTALLGKAARAPVPRRSRGPRRSDREKRLREKHLRGDLKRTRRPATEDD